MGHINRMKSNRYFIILIGLAAVVGVMWLVESKDWLVRRAVVKAVEDATGVSVQLSSLRVELTKGDGVLKDFRMGNPKGFSRENLLAVRSGKVDLDLASLASDTLRIQKVQMDNVSLLFEGRGQANNMKALQAQVNQRSSSHKAKEGQKKSKLIRIDSLVLSDVKLDVRMPGIVKIGNLDLGTIRMNNLGGSKGAPASEIAAQVANEISSRATTAVIRNSAQLAAQMGQDATKFAEGLGIPIPSVVDDAAGFLQNLFK